MVALRPVNSFIIAVGLRGGQGYVPGDFSAAWSVLPVPREKVMRGVYLHGFIMGTLIYVLALGVNILKSWIEFGAPGIYHEEGESAVLFAVPFAALIPCLAGGITAAATGDRTLSFLSLGAGIAVLVGHLACLMADLPGPLHAGLLILLAVVGGTPPLKHLRGPSSISKAPAVDRL
jgi:hypothetical protein